MAETTKTKTQMSIVDLTDINLSAEICSTVGSQITQSGYAGALYCRIFSQGEELDTLPTYDFKTSPADLTAGEVYFYINSTNKTISLKSASGATTWEDTTFTTPTATYTWSFKDKNNQSCTVSTIDSSSTHQKMVYLDGTIIDEKLIVSVEVSYVTEGGIEINAVAEYTITDITDVITTANNLKNGNFTVTDNSVVPESGGGESGGTTTTTDESTDESQITLEDETAKNVKMQLIGKSATDATINQKTTIRPGYAYFKDHYTGNYSYISSPYGSPIGDLAKSFRILDVEDHKKTDIDPGYLVLKSGDDYFKLRVGRDSPVPFGISIGKKVNDTMHYSYLNTWTKVRAYPADSSALNTLNRYNTSYVDIGYAAFFHNETTGLCRFACNGTYTPAADKDAGDEFLICSLPSDYCPTINLNLGANRNFAAYLDYDSSVDSYKHKVKLVCNRSMTPGSSSDPNKYIFRINALWMARDVETYTAL